MARPVQRFRVHQTLTDCSPFEVVLPVAAAQTFKRGDPVILTAGKVATGNVTDTDTLLGIAGEDANNIAAPLTTDVVKVYVFNEGTVFIGCITAAGTSVLASVGTVAGLTVESSVAKVDLTKTNPATTGRFRIIGLGPYGPKDGELGGEVTFTCLNAHSALFN